jgi:hypothetical protein
VANSSALLHVPTGLHVLDHLLEVARSGVHPTKALLKRYLWRLEREEGVLDN